MRHVLPLVLLPFLATAHADLKRGAALHEKNCVACHSQLMGGDGNRIYTRPDRGVQSLPALKTQVGRCKDNLGLMWFDDEVSDVVEYLNTHFYQFDPGSRP